MRLLLIRPETDAASTASELKKHNIDVVCDPLLSIKKKDAGLINFSAYQAIIFTSPNAIRSYPYPDQAKGILTFAVGQKTASVAQDFGFKHVISGDGDAAKLTDKIKFTIFTKNGPILYPCGVDRAGSIAEDLSDAFFQVDIREIYQATAAETLHTETIHNLQDGQINFIPFFSPRSAHIFIGLVKKAGLESKLNSVTALCLSANVEDAVRTLNWKEIRTAIQPDQLALFKLIDIDLEGTP